MKQCFLGFGIILFVFKLTISAHAIESETPLTMDSEERAPASGSDSPQIISNVDLLPTSIMASKCEIRERKMDSGKTLYRVVDRDGVIHGSSYGLQQAQSLAGNDSRCR